MSASDGPELIKPQVKPAVTQHVPTKEELAAEKKRRIDEALARYTGEATTANAVAPATSTDRKPAAPATELPKPEKNQSSPKHQADAQFVAAHLDEVREVVERMMNRREQKKDEAEAQGQVIAPTSIDPDATIALAVKELRERAEEEAKRQAAEAEEQQRPINRYRADPAEHFMPTIHNRTQLIKLAVVWLAAIPLALLLNLLVNALGDSIVASLLFVFVWVLGAYGALGWIPLMVSYIRNNM